MRREVPEGKPLHHDSIGPSARETLESLTVETMYFHAPAGDAHNTTPMDVPRFPALKSLRLKACVMDYPYPSLRHSVQ